MAGWRDIPESTQNDLIEWYNQRDIDSRDKRILARLYHAHQFYAYDCGYCGDRVRQAQPDNWNNFQGVCQDEGIGQLCGECYRLYENLRWLASE